MKEFESLQGRQRFLQESCERACAGKMGFLKGLMAESGRLALLGGRLMVGQVPLEHFV